MPLSCGDPVEPAAQADQGASGPKDVPDPGQQPRQRRSDQASRDARSPPPPAPAAPVGCQKSMVPATSRSGWPWVGLTMRRRLLAFLSGCLWSGRMCIWRWAASLSWSCSAASRLRPRRSRSWSCVTNSRSCVAGIHGPAGAQGSRPAGSAEPPAPSSPLVGVPGQARDPPRLASAYGAPTVDRPVGAEGTPAGSRPGTAADPAIRPGESAVGLPADRRRTAPPWLPDLGQLHPTACPRRRSSTSACLDHLAVVSAPAGGRHPGLRLLHRRHCVAAAAGGAVRHRTGWPSRPVISSSTLVTVPPCSGS
jgi:hypothetical protein